MSLFFPVIYSSFVLILLLILNFYIFKQLFSFQVVIKKLNKIENNKNIRTLNLQILCELAKLYSYNKNYTKAIELYKLILKKNSNLDSRCQSYLYNLIATTFFKDNNYQQSLIYLKKALLTCEYNNIALISLKKLYQQLEDKRKISNIKELEKSINLLSN